VNILYLSSEAVPFAKTGGLGDVSGALPRVLAASEKVTLLMPGYRTEAIRRSRTDVVDDFSLRIGAETHGAVIKKTAASANYSVCFVHNDHFFARDGIYGDDAGDYPDNFTRFLFFQKAALEYARRNNLRFDIIHGNDWQTALVPLFMRIDPLAAYFAGTKSVFTIHNLGYQGIFPAAAFAETALPPYLFSPEHLEFFGDLNCLKSGIIFSDRLLTVSPTYAREIVSRDQGFGLDGLLAKYAFKLSGILNGVDYSQWDPQDDPFIVQRYSVRSLPEKTKNKEALFSELGLAGKSHSPLMIMISRISQQKGMELLPRLLPLLFQEDIYFVFLGKGDRSLTAEIADLAGRFPGRLKFLNAFDEKMAHRLQAAGDLLFMPSAYEPCGLNQIYGLRYGTVPIVRATGGLDDSVQEFDPATLRGTGFKFRGNDIAAVLAVIRNALRLFRDRSLWSRIQENGMAMDFSWERAAASYLTLYKNISLEDTQHV
jgi:starch synthase